MCPIWKQALFKTSNYHLKHTNKRAQAHTRFCYDLLAVASLFTHFTAIFPIDSEWIPLNLTNETWKWCSYGIDCSVLSTASTSYLHTFIQPAGERLRLLAAIFHSVCVCGDWFATSIRYFDYAYNDALDFLEIHSQYVFL